MTALANLRADPVSGLNQNDDQISTRCNGWVRYLVRAINGQLTKAALYRNDAGER